MTTKTKIPGSLYGIGLGEFEMQEISLETMMREMSESQTKARFIKLEAKDYGDGNRWENCNVSMARVDYSLEMIKIMDNRMNTRLENTGKDYLGRAFIGNINRKEALKLNLSLGGKTLTLRQYADFLKLLKSKKAYDGNGMKIDPKILENIFNDITQAKSPWRAEWIDGEVLYRNNEWYLAQSHILDAQGNLIPQYIKPLDECLMEDKTPGIILDQWIKNPTKQGFPRKNIQPGDVYCMGPDKDNNSAVRIFASEDGLNLGFDGDKLFRSRDLGIRLVLDKIER